MTDIGDYFTLEELTFSEMAIRKGLDNQPSPVAVEALTALCTHILDPLREKLALPIVITSGYRSPQVNRLIGGSQSSQHCKGEAADLYCRYRSIESLFNEIRRSDLAFDQVIDEFGRWVHISYSIARQRRQALRAIRKGPSTIYLPVTA